MHRALVLALLWGLAYGRPPMDTVWLAETFETGTIPYTGKPSQWTYSGTPITGYPLIYQIGYLDAYTGEGNGGGYGLRVIPELLDPDYNFYNGYLSMYAQTQGQMSPDATQGFVSVDVDFDANLADLREWSYDYPDIYLFGLAKTALEVKLTPDGSNWRYQVEWQKYTHYEAGAYGLAQSAALTTGQVATGAFQTLRLEWKQSTLTQVAPSGNNWFTVASDGWIKLYVGGVAVIDQQNIQLMVNAYGYNDAWDAWHTDMIGKYGVWYTYSVAGTYDNIRLGAWADAVDTWVDIPNFVEVELDSALFEGGHARVFMLLWTRDTGPTIQARLYNVDDAVSVGESAVVAATTPTEATFTVTLTTGIRHYRAQVTTDTPEVDLFALCRGLSY